MECPLQPCLVIRSLYKIALDAKVYEINFHYLFKCLVDQDGAEPSPNSVSAGNLLRLSMMLDRDDWFKMAERIFKVFSQRIEKVPVAVPELVSALLFYHSSPKQVCIVLATPFVAFIIRQSCKTASVHGSLFLRACRLFNAITYLLLIQKIALTVQNS